MIISTHIETNKHIPFIFNWQVRLYKFSVNRKFWYKYIWQTVKFKLFDRYNTLHIYHAYICVVRKTKICSLVFTYINIIINYSDHDVSPSLKPNSCFLTSVLCPFTNTCASKFSSSQLLIITVLISISKRSTCARFIFFVPTLFHLTWYQHSFMVPQMSGSPFIRSSSPLYKYIIYFSVTEINHHDQNQFREERILNKLGLCFHRDKSPSSNRHGEKNRELNAHVISIIY